MLTLDVPSLSKVPSVKKEIQKVPSVKKEVKKETSVKKAPSKIELQVPETVEVAIKNDTRPVQNLPSALSIKNFTKALSELDRRIENEYKTTPVVVTTRTQKQYVPELHQFIIKKINYIGAEYIYSKWLELVNTETALVNIHNIPSPIPSHESITVKMNKTLNEISQLLAPEAITPVTQTIYKQTMDKTNANVFTLLLATHEKGMHQHKKYTKKVYKAQLETFKAYMSCTMAIAKEVWENILGVILGYKEQLNNIKKEFQTPTNVLKQHCSQYMTEWTEFIKEYASLFTAHIPENAKMAYVVMMKDAELEDAPLTSIRAYTDMWEKTQQVLKLNVGQRTAHPNSQNIYRHALNAVQAQSNAERAKLQQYQKHVPQSIEKINEYNIKKNEVIQALHLLQQQENQIRKDAEDIESSLPVDIVVRHEEWKQLIMKFEPRSAHIVSLKMELKQKLNAQIRQVDYIANRAIEECLQLYYERSTQCQQQLLHKESVTLQQLNAMHTAVKNQLNADTQLLMNEYNKQDAFSGGAHAIDNFLNDVQLSQKQYRVIELKQFAVDIKKIFK